MKNACLHIIRLICCLIIAGTITILPAYASEFAGEWSGHIRAQGAASSFKKPHILEYTGDTGPLYDGGVDARLNGTLFVGQRLSLEANYEAVLSGGESRELLSSFLPGTPAGGFLLPGPPSDDRRLFSLTHVITENENRLAYHRLDRLSATYTSGMVTVRMGRQALTWGNGLIFNPLDLLNPFAPSDVIRDYKIGDDMLVVQGYTDFFSDLQTAWVPRRNPDTNRVTANDASMAGKAKWSAAGADWDVMLARHFEDIVTGVGMVRYVKNAAWRTDISYTAMNSDYSDGYFSAVSNIDYSWIWGGYNYYGLLEIYYNGLGDSDPAASLTDPEVITRMNRGDMVFLGKAYAAGQIQFEAHPLVNLFLSVIANLNDPSMLLQPRLTWDILSSTRLMAGIDIPVGASGTEYGGIKEPITGKPTGMPVKTYIMGTWYF